MLMKTFLKIPLFCIYVLLAGACTKGTGVADKGNQKDNELSSSTKNVLIMEFVSFDCVYCPNVTNLLEEASKKYPGRIDVISVHGRLEQDDPMEFKGYKKFQNYFYGITGYPAVIIDQDDAVVSVGTFDASQKSFLDRLNAPAKVDIAVGSTVIADNAVRLEVKVTNKDKNNLGYSLAVAVLENNISYKQANQVNGSLQWIEDYQHTHVLRAFLSENYFGDPIGALAEKGSYSKTFTYTVPVGYKKDNLSFVVYVIENKGFEKSFAINSRSVKIGKSIGF